MKRIKITGNDVLLTSLRIFKCKLTYLLFLAILTNIISRQREFAEHMYTSMFATCRSGALGKLEMVLLYAFRDHLDKLEWGS